MVVGLSAHVCVLRMVACNKYVGADTPPPYPLVSPLRIRPDTGRSDAFVKGRLAHMSIAEGRRESDGGSDDGSDSMSREDSEYGEGGRDGMGALLSAVDAAVASSPMSALSSPRSAVTSPRGGAGVGAGSGDGVDSVRRSISSESSASIAAARLSLSSSTSTSTVYVAGIFRTRHLCAWGLQGWELYELASKPVRDTCASCRDKRRSSEVDNIDFPSVRSARVSFRKRSH